MRTFRHTLKILLAVTLGLGLFCVPVGAALAASTHSTIPAHASVLSAVPAIGSTVTTAPTKVTVTTAENINPDPTKSNLFVYGPSGEATDTLISQGNAQIPLSNPKEMSINITPNSGHADGVYVVMWKTVSADDGDPATGAFSFTVSTGGASGAPTSNPPQTQSTTSANPTSTPTNTAGTPLWVSIVAALIALIVGLGVGRFAFAGQRQPKPAKPASSFSALRAEVAAKDAEPEEAHKRP